MRLTVDFNGKDELRVDGAILKSREDFSRFVDAISIAAEALWPSPQEDEEADEDDGITRQ